MAKNTSKTYVNGLLDTLIKLDVSVNSAYYEMGQLLSSFIRDKLWDIIGYESFPHMVEEELSFSYKTALNYATLYNEFQRLHYNKKEALDLLDEYGITNLNRVFIKEKNKIGTRAVRARIDAIDFKQINFGLTKAQLKEAHAALQSLGAEETKDGRWLHMSEAFMELVRSYKPLKKAA